jgi:integrase
MDSARLHAIDSSLVEQFVQHRLKPRKGKTLTPVTVNHSLRTLRRILHVAKEWKLVREVPKIKLLPGEHQRDYVLTDAEVKKMTAHLAAKYPESVMRHALPFLVDTGLRISELCALKIEDVQRASKPWSVRVVKGKSKYARREVPLTDRAAGALAAALALSKSEWVFTTNAGRTRITSNYPSVLFRRTRDAVKIAPECVLHSTRHTYATKLGKAGADAFVIQRLCGHSSVLISQRYVHSDMASKEKAVALLDVLNKPAREGPFAEHARLLREKLKLAVVPHHKM